MDKYRESNGHVVRTLDARDAAYRDELQRIGRAIGYGNAQHILGELWDDMLESMALPRGRGGMTVTIDDDLPPLPKATKLRREQAPHGGYRMRPAYTESEMRQYARRALDAIPETGEARDERLTLSSRDLATPAVDALVEWATLRGLPLDEARVRDWRTAAPVEPDGPVSIQMKCEDCGHEQTVKGNRLGGQAYFGSGFNWCDRCEGLPKRIGDQA